MVCDIKRENCYGDKSIPRVMRRVQDQATFKESLMKSLKKYAESEKENTDAEDDQLLYQKPRETSIGVEVFVNMMAPDQE